MTMKRKMLRGLIAGLVGLAAAISAVGGGGLPGSAASCQRTIAIDPQVTVSEASRTLTFVVHTNACAAAGSVSYRAADGTAKRQLPGQPTGGDYALEPGALVWPAGDLSSRKITVAIVNDLVPEPLLEDFRVVLGNPSDTIRIAGRGIGHARVFDDDGQLRAAAIDDGICLISGETSCQPSRPGGSAPFSGPIGTQTFEPVHLLIALNQPNPVDTTIQFQTMDGGLRAGLDYLPVSGPVTVPAGTIAITVEVQLMDHAFTQPGQSFFAQISGYTAGSVADPFASFTMLS